jgi:hypothetical protein
MSVAGPTRRCCTSSSRSTFLERAEQSRGLPDFIVEEFEAYLRCGMLEHGIARRSPKLRGGPTSDSAACSNAAAARSTKTRSTTGPICSHESSRSSNHALMLRSHRPRLSSSSVRTPSGCSSISSTLRLILLLPGLTFTPSERKNARARYCQYLRSRVTMRRRASKRRSRRTSPLGM